MKMPTATRKVGRPSDFKHEYTEQAEKLAQLGATDVEIADFFNVHVSTIYLWKHTHRSFSESLKVGKDSVDERVVRSLYQRALGYSHDEEKIFQSDGEIITYDTVKHYPPDTTAAIFWLKNRNKVEWRDKFEYDHDHGGDVNITSITRTIVKP